MNGTVNQAGVYVQGFLAAARNSTTNDYSIRANLLTL